MRSRPSTPSSGSLAARATGRLAAYQLGEIKEIMSDIGELYQKFKDLPLDKMLDDVITGPIAETEKALDAKDFPKFSAAYGTLTDACNACHQATGNGFIVIQQPVRPGLSQPGLPAAQVTMK